MTIRVALPETVNELSRRRLIKLAKYAIKRLKVPRKDLGQNFVIDPRLVRTMVELIDPLRDYKILEIGPGHGVLTFYVSQRSKHVVAIEINRKLVNLCKTLIGEHCNNVDIVHGDALLFDWSKFTTIVSNLPFSITSEVLAKIVREQIKHCIITVQTEVANRLTARPGSEDYGRLTILVQCFYNVRRVLKLPSSAFLPSPEVTATLVELRLKERENFCIPPELLHKFEKFTSLLFSQRNKNVRKVLREVFGREVSCSNVDLSKRVYQLTIPELVTLFFTLLDSLP